MSLYDSPHTPRSNQRLLAAVVLCGLILLGSDWATQHYLGRHLLGAPLQPAASTAVTAAASSPAVQPAPVVAEPVLTAIRLPLQNERVSGAINTQGGALDSLTLRRYRNEITEPAGYPLLQPAATSPTAAEYVVAGWQGAGVAGPDAQSIWQPVAAAANPAAQHLVWRNTAGQQFERIWHLRPNSYV